MDKSPQPNVPSPLLRLAPGPIAFRFSLFHEVCDSQKLTRFAAPFIVLIAECSIVNGLLVPLLVLSRSLVSDLTADRYPLTFLSPRV